MKIFLVQSAGDLMGAQGYGRGLLDSGNRLVLVTFADTTFNRRPTIMPEADHPGWNQLYQAPTPTMKDDK